MGIFGNAFSGWHVLIILAVVLLLFGATRLPALARSVGQSVKILRKESGRDEVAKDSGVTADAAESSESSAAVTKAEPAPARTDATT